MSLPFSDSVSLLLDVSIHNIFSRAAYTNVQIPALLEYLYDRHQS